MPGKGLSDSRFLVRVAVLGAMGFALMYIEFPLPFLPPFLKYDLGDVPALLAAFAMGPLAGILSEIIKCTIFFLSGKGDAGLVGAAANFIAGGALVAGAGLVYRRFHDLRGAVLGLAAGSLAMVAAMTIANIYVFLPLWGVPAEQVVPMALTATVPFNLAKGVLTSVITFVFYKRVRYLLK